VRLVLLSVAPILLMLATTGCDVVEPAEAESEFVMDISEERAKQAVEEELHSMVPAGMVDGDSLEFLGNQFEDGSYHWTVLVHSWDNSYRRHWNVEVSPEGQVTITESW